eukprot:5177090-Pyramimonas_sp.AAC.1
MNDNVFLLVPFRCEQVERLLDQSDSKSAGQARKQAEDVGPDTELEYWRNRMAKFNSITEQLKSNESKLVMGVTMAGRTQVKGEARYQTRQEKYTKISDRKTRKKQVSKKKSQKNEGKRDARPQQWRRQYRNVRETVTTTLRHNREGACD